MSDRPAPLSVPEVIAAIGEAHRELAKVPCDPKCPLMAKPHPTGPGTCHRCKASGKLHDLTARLSWQVPR